MDRARTDAEFMDRMDKIVPELGPSSGLRWAELGLVLAGESVAAILLSPPHCAHTYFDTLDLFVIGTQSDQNSAITALGNHLYARVGEITVARRTHDSVVFAARDKIQHTYSVSLQEVGSLHDVLRRFDVGSHAFAFDGTRVWASDIGKLAAERGCNVLCDRIYNKDDVSYVSDLSRQFRLGFDVVVPDSAMRPFLPVHVTAPSRKWPVGVHPHVTYCYNIGPEDPADSSCAQTLFVPGMDVAAFIHTHTHTHTGRNDDVQSCS
jgi:hypothetical protein